MDSQNPSQIPINLNVDPTVSHGVPSGAQICAQGAKMESQGCPNDIFGYPIMVPWAQFGYPRCSRTVVLKLIWNTYVPNRVGYPTMVPWAQFGYPEMKISSTLALPPLLNPTYPASPQSTSR